MSAVPRVIYDLTPVSTSSRYRGIGTYTLDLASAFVDLAPDDIDLQFLVGFHGQYALVEPGSLDRQAIFARCGGKEAEPYQRYYAEKRTAMRWFLSRSGAALYHAPDPKGTPHMRSVKRVVTAHDLIPTLLGPPYRWYPYAVSAAIDTRRYAHDHVIAISDWTARDVATAAHVDPARITVVHHGVEHTRFYPAPPKAPRARPYFFYVGGFDQRKQVVELIEAFGSIAGDVPEDLVIAGKPDPSQRRALDAAAVRSGAGDRVHILGFVPDDALVDLYRGATAHALPTLYEGFGMTALEAMACGCPVVTVRASCVPEICGDGAEYAEPRDIPGLARALRRVSTDPVHRADLVARGLARAATFTWRRAAEATLGVYRKVLMS